MRKLHATGDDTPDTDTPSASPPDADSAYTVVLEESFSRNKHFAWYQAQPGAVRTFRRLVHGILSSLREAGEDARITVTPDPGAGRYHLSLLVPRYRLRHQCWLEGPELAALRTHPEIGPRLRFTDDVS